MGAPEPTGHGNRRCAARRETERRIELLSERCQSLLGNSLLGILLVGSAARARESYAMEGEKLLLLSDLDLYCVVRRSETRSADTVRELHELADSDPFFLNGLDLSIVGQGALEGMDDALKASQARGAHRWVWRRDGWEAPTIRAAGDREPGAIDAFRLVCNRAAEELLHTRPDGRPEDTLQAAYTRWKLLRDLPLALYAALAPEVRVATARADIAGELRTRLRWPRLDGLLDSIESLNVDFETGPVTKARLDAVTRVDTSAHRRGISHQELIESVWPAYRFVALRACESGLSIELCIERSESQGSNCTDGDLELFRSVPRRGGTLGTLRRAYLYRREAPKRTRPWWRYALDGPGPERVQAAAALAFAGSADPASLLRDLYGESDLMRRGASGNPCDALWYGQQWRDWILGEA